MGGMHWGPFRIAKSFQKAEETNSKFKNRLSFLPVTIISLSSWKWYQLQIILLLELQLLYLLYVVVMKPFKCIVQWHSFL